MPEFGRDGTHRPPADVPAVADLVTSNPHGDPLWRRVGRGTVHALVPADDVRAVAEQAASIQRTVITGRRIAVAGMHGGAGKSTISALLATVFTHYRQDRVLALDIDPDLGSLALRLGVTREHSLGDLAAATPGFTSFQEVEPHLTRAGKRLWTLTGNHGRIGDSPLNIEVYGEAAVPLTRFFGITLVDCGSGITAALPSAVLESAHAQVLVTPATPNGARSVGRALDWMRSNGLGDQVARTVVVFTVRTPHLRRTLDLGRASAILAEVGVTCLKFGYDRHIAGGAPLDPKRLAHATRTTAVRLAALALERASAP